MRRRGARPVRRRGPGKRAGGNTGTAPRADPYHVNIRLEEHKLCLLVLIGVRADGRKELVALADGYRESSESWADLLRDCARRGHARPGARGRRRRARVLGRAARGVPAGREQRCWFHKIANVLGALPKSAHPGAKKALAEIWNAEDRRHALDAVTGFKAAYGAKFPKAVAKITDDLDELLAFYDYPAEHWIHLRTTNPIESTFATVRHRTKITRGPGSRAAGLAMAFKLIEAAQDRWRAVNGPHLVALVRAGADVRQRQARRTTRRTPPTRSRLKDLHPQVLTIAPRTTGLTQRARSAADRSVRSVQSPGPHLRAYLGQGVPADRRIEAGQHRPGLRAHPTRPERVPEERERGVLVRSRAALPSLQYTIRVLSGCSSSPTSLHPFRDRRQHLPGLASR